MKPNRMMAESFSGFLFTNSFIKAPIMAFKPNNVQHYTLHKYRDPIVISLGCAFTYFGLRRQSRQDLLPLEEVFALKSSDINGFDRSAIDQNPAFLDRSKRRSDIYLGATMGMVSFLALNKSIRSEWKESLIMYLESTAISMSVYTWTSLVAKRKRPLAYMTNIDTLKRIDNQNANSFYSGHTSSAATASFFAAKTFVDHHPNLGSKKWLVYSAALIPPAIVGGLRIKAGKHFYSDVLMGTAMGALSGILVPQLHKRSESKISLTPSINGTALGFSFSYNIKKNNGY